MLMFKTLRAVKFLFTGPVILVMLFVISGMTGGHWFKWAALGIAIAWVISLFRVLRAMIVLGGLTALVAYLLNRQQHQQHNPGAPNTNLQ